MAFFLGRLLVMLVFLLPSLVLSLASPWLVSFLLLLLMLVAFMSYSLVVSLANLSLVSFLVVISFSCLVLVKVA